MKMSMGVVCPATWVHFLPPGQRVGVGKQWETISTREAPWESRKWSFGTRKQGFCQLPLFQLTRWEREQAKISLGLRIFIRKMGNQEFFPNLKSYMFIPTGGCLQPNIYIDNQHYCACLFL